jgi:prepilin-type N-terminal cleavage/methylation domain-containing protein
LEQAVKIKSAKGFSLIELLIVMAIAATLLSIAVPTYNRYRDNANLREAAGEISGDIQLFKQTAVSENRGYRINFDASANAYGIQIENPVGSGTYVNLSTVKPGAQDTKNVGAGNANVVISGTPSFSGGVPHVTFNPRGTSGAGNLVLIHSIRLSTATIRTTLMGRVRVEYDLK